MKVVMLGLIGFVLGAIVGGVIGVGLGFVWTSLFHTSSFEGYSGMLVFFTFMPMTSSSAASRERSDLAFLPLAIARRYKPRLTRSVLEYRACIAGFSHDLRICTTEYFA